MATDLHRIGLREYIIRLIVTDSKSVNQIAKESGVQYNNLISIVNGRKRMGMVIAQRLIDHYNIVFQQRPIVDAAPSQEPSLTHQEE